MEPYSRSHSRTHFNGHKKPPNLPTNGNNGGGYVSTSYDDVFGGPPKYATLAPRAEDYSEIFGAFRSAAACNSRASSIPVLDLPDSDAIGAGGGVEFDYSDVFGGFDDVGFAVSFDQLFRPFDARHCCSSSSLSDDEAWTPVGAESLSDDSDPFALSEKSHCFSSENFNQPVDKQFSVSYNKVNLGTNTCISSTTHVTQLNAVSGFTCVVDETASLRETGPKGRNPTEVDDIIFNVNSLSTLPEKHKIKNISETSLDAGLKSFDGAQVHLRAYAASTSHETSSLESVSDINHTAKSTNLLSEALDDKLPPCFDMEVDPSSFTTASTAVMKDAMKKARAKLKAATVLMDTVKGGVKGVADVGLTADGQNGDNGKCKEVTQCYEFVTGDSNRVVSQPPSNFDGKISFSMKQFDEHNSSDSAEDAIVPEGNRPRLKSIKLVSRQSYYDKMFKVAQEVHDTAIGGHVNGDHELTSSPRANHKEQKEKFGGESEKSVRELGHMQRVEKNYTTNDVKIKSKNVSGGKQGKRKGTKSCHQDQSEQRTYGFSEIKEEKRRMKELHGRVESGWSVPEVVGGSERQKRDKEANEEQKMENKLADSAVQKRGKEEKEVEEKRLEEPSESYFDGNQEVGQTKDMKRQVDGERPRKGPVDVFGREKLERTRDFQENDNKIDVLRKNEDGNFVEKSMKHGIEDKVIRVDMMDEAAKISKKTGDAERQNFVCESPIIIEWWYDDQGSERSSEMRNENNNTSGELFNRSGNIIKPKNEKIAESVSNPMLVKDYSIAEGGRRINLGGAHVLSDQNEKVKSTPVKAINRCNGNMEKRSHLPDVTQSTEQSNEKCDLEDKTENKEKEEKEREREREKDREGVEIATREARERVMNEARERLEKACAEARQRSLADKAASEARLKADRVAVERATAEARQRAIEKAMQERMLRSISEKYLPERDVQRQSSMPSMHGAEFEAGDVEPAQRCKARLERNLRTVERVAKALAEKNMRDLLAQKEQAERSRLAETLGADIKRWSNGKEGNLRALLSTLQYILGPDSGWQPIPLTEVITATAVKKAYRKAALCVHPDKLQQRGASIQHKYVCEKVFDLLKEAWNIFNSEEK